MNKKIAIELIKLESLNRCSSEDSEAIQFLKRNDEDFPWKELGDYQNMIAVLSIKSSNEMPGESLKDEIIKKACELKNIIVPENNCGELKAVAEESFTINLREFESTKPGILPKYETSVAGIPPSEKDTEIEELIEEKENEKKNFAPENEKIAVALDDLILLKQPDLFKFQDSKNNNSIEEIQEIKEIVKEEEIEDIEEEKQVYNQTIDKIDLENNLDVKVKRISSQDKDIEPEITEENIQPVPEPEINLEISSGTNRTADFENKKSSPNRSSKSNLIIVIALIVIAVPIVLFLNSSKEGIKGETKKSFNKESIVSNLELPEPIVKQIEKVENFPKADEKISEKEVQKIETDQPPSIPEAVFIEPKSFDIIEGKKNNIEQKEDIKVNIPQEEKTIENEPAIFVAVEEMPEPLKGLSEIQRRVVYPRIASLSGVEGKVIIQAIVDEAGNVTNADVIKGIGSGCDEAALKAIFGTKFKPGKQRGKAVKVKVTIPIVFKKS